MFDQIRVFFLTIFDYFLSILQTLPRDLRGVYKLIRHTLLIKYYIYRQQNFLDLFRQNVKNYRTKKCFIFEDTSLTFQEVRCSFSINFERRFYSI